ncbi:MAG: trigger factor [Treponema sp.]|nr:trigger factor [Treponema sp.]
MIISKEITNLEHSRVKITVVIGKDDVSAEYDKILTDYSKNLQIPGFRKGKVPKEVIVRKLGEALKKEVVGHIIEHSMTEFFEDENSPKENLPLAYSQPSLEGELPCLDLGKDLSYTMVYDVFPRFTVGQWKGLEVEIPDVSITEDDVNRELEDVRERNAFVLDKPEDAEAMSNDVATVSYSELDENGAVISGTEREDFVFTIGSGYNVFKFDEDIIGMKKGETRDIVKTYSEDFAEKDLAGKTKKIRIKITSLKKKNIPIADDDFAQDVDEKFKTLDDLKDDIKEKLTKRLDERLKEVKINRIIGKILEQTPIDIPESMMRVQLDAQWRNFARQFNMPVYKLKEGIVKSPEGLASFEDLWRPEASRAIMTQLVIQTIIKDLNLEITDDEFNKFVEKRAKEYGMSVEEFTDYYKKQDIKDYLKDEMREMKLFDILIAENTVKIGAKEEFLSFINQKTEEKVVADV